MKVNLNTSTKIDIEAKRNDTFSLLLHIKEEGNIPYDFSGYNAFMDVWGTDRRLTVGLTTLHTTALALTSFAESYIPSSIELGSGTIKVNLRESEMDMDKGVYKYELRIVGLSSSKTWFHGKFKIVE